MIQKSILYNIIMSKYCMISAEENFAVDGLINIYLQICPRVYSKTSSLILFCVLVFGLTRPALFWSASSHNCARGPFDKINTRPAANLLLFARRGEVRAVFTVCAR